MKLPELYPVEGGFSCVVSAGVDDQKRRIQFRLRIATGDGKLARERLTDILRLRAALVKAGRGPEAQYLMTKAGEKADDNQAFAEALAIAQMVEALPRAESGPRWKTWGELAHAWADGEITRAYPGKNIGEKDSERDKQRIEWLEKDIGTVPLETFGEDDYNRAMANLPPRCKTTATRRHYGLIVLRVMRIAKKCKLVTSWHLDGVEPPKVSKKDKPVFTCLFPEDLDMLLPAAVLEYQWRLLWGFMCYESPRIGKLREVRWHHIETDGNGAISMESKNGEVLYWDLQPGSLRALLHMKKLAPRLTGPFAWLTAAQQHQAAKLLRKHLMLVGADRPSLHEDDGRRRKLRAHDTRATFVVFAFLAGRNETFIMDRTGHTTSEMVHRYDRLSRVSQGKGWRPLGRLDEALGLTAANDGDSPAKASTVTAAVTVESLSGRGRPDAETQVFENTGTDSLFRCRDSNSDSGIQRAVPDDRTPQNTGVFDGCDASEGARTDPLSRSTVTENFLDVTTSPTQVDPDAALQLALDRATAAGRWEFAERILSELSDRRQAREAREAAAEPQTGVIDVAEFRARRAKEGK